MTAAEGDNASGLEEEGCRKEVTDIKVVVDLKDSCV